MINIQENHIDHEVRIRVQEQLSKQILDKLDALNNKVDSHFIWTIGLIFISIIIPVALHSMKLV